MNNDILLMAQSLRDAGVDLRVPYVYASISTIGGSERPTVFFKISLDPQDTWVNGIIENSRYGLFAISFPDQKIELISGHGKFRKCSFKTEKEAIRKIQGWINLGRR